MNPSIFPHPHSPKRKLGGARFPSSAPGGQPATKNKSAIPSIALAIVVD
jgi:hypothetical protein